MRLKIIIFALGLTFPTSLSAQDMVNPGIWGNGLLGQSAMDNARENTRNTRENSRNDRRSSRLPECNESLVPPAEYRRLEAEYGRRVRVDGKPSADRWSEQQAAIWTQRLKQEGVCR